MPQPLKAAVVGLGRIGWVFHVKQLVASPRFQLTAVVDPLAERRREAEAETGCRSYRDLNGLLKNEDLDVVAIASPTKLHERQTKQVIESGAHVVLEKPMTTSVRSADRMIACARDNGRHIFMYQPHRLLPVTQTVREVLASGILGPVHLLRRGVYRFARRNDWQSLRKNGGGMLNNYGAHYIDQTVSLFGEEIVDVRCNLWAVATLGDADDVVRVWLKTASGALIDVEINQASSHALPGWHICGKYGTLVEEGDELVAKYYDPAEAAPLDIVEGAAPNRSYDNQDRLPWREKRFSTRGGHKLDFYENVFDTIQDNAEPYVKLEEARELMRILDLCRRRSGF